MDARGPGPGGCRTRARIAAAPIANHAGPDAAAKADSATGWSSPIRPSVARGGAPEGWIVFALAGPEGPFQQKILLLRGWREVMGLTVRAAPSVVIGRSVDSARRQGDPDPGAVVSWTTSLVLGAMTGLLPTAILTL